MLEEQADKNLMKFNKHKVLHQGWHKSMQHVQPGEQLCRIGSRNHDGHQAQCKLAVCL